MKLMRWVSALATAGLMPTAAWAAAPADTVANDGAEAAAEATSNFVHAAPVEGVGMPTGSMMPQPQVTELGERAANFHNGPLLWMCILISAFVLLLLLYTLIRYRRGANPVPSKNSHNTMIEIIWTVVPVIILVLIAIPSIKLINKQFSPPPADVTIKVVGNQWYWTYEYPDNGINLTSNMLKEQADVGPGERYRTDADGPPLLAVDERIVIPVGKTVKFLTTSSDVIHSFAVPAFWIKIDTVPGRTNETWVKAEKEGVYFGQCSELCGARHGFMPIAVEVVSEERFAAWVASKGGNMGGDKAEAGDAPAAADAAPVDNGTPAEAEPADAPAAA